jgi:hypothetical protein
LHSDPAEGPHPSAPPLNPRLFNGVLFSGAGHVFLFTDMLQCSASERGAPVRLGPAFAAVMFHEVSLGVAYAARASHDQEKPSGGALTVVINNFRVSYRSAPCICNSWRRQRAGAHGRNSRSTGQASIHRWQRHPCQPITSIDHSPMNAIPRVPLEHTAITQKQTSTKRRANHCTRPKLLLLSQVSAGERN